MLDQILAEFMTQTKSEQVQEVTTKLVEAYRTTGYTSETFLVSMVVTIRGFLKKAIDDGRLTLSTPEVASGD